ncbi:uncharacterized protein LOC111245486 isoform X1 [Varroa destructor]|uniref:Uncharacterized protein n=1 Tax=Varroa destructor TaxID=109461 RepID=A0A7M7MBD7_VARDE|nr:uncharacterized protein LOC111245486 isoform X1 [Varroa destructor]
MLAAVGHLVSFLYLFLHLTDAYVTDLSTKIYLNNDGAVFVVVASEKLNQQEAVALCIAQGLQLRSPTYEKIREIRKRACNEKRNQLASNTTLPSATGREKQFIRLVGAIENQAIRRRHRCITRRFFVCALPKKNSLNKTKIKQEVKEKRSAYRLIESEGVESTNWTSLESGRITSSQGTAVHPTARSKGKNDTDEDLSILEATMLCLIPWNIICLSFSMWVISHLKWSTVTRHVLHMNQFAMLLIGQILLAFFMYKFCHTILKVHIHFVFVSALLLTTVEAIHFIQATIPKSMYYLGIAYFISLVYVTLGVEVYSERRDDPHEKQLCSTLVDRGSTIYMLAPAVTSLLTTTVISVLLLYHHHHRTDNSQLTANAGLNISQMTIMSFLLSLQWIFGSFVRSEWDNDTDVFGVLFFITGILVLPTAVTLSHVVCNRECRSVLARRLGQGGKTSRRIANMIRPSPQNVTSSGGGCCERHVETHNSQPFARHERLHVNDRLRTILERGIRPSIHLIFPLELARVQNC